MKTVLYKKVTVEWNKIKLKWCSHLTVKLNTHLVLNMEQNHHYYQLLRKKSERNPYVGICILLPGLMEQRQSNKCNVMFSIHLGCIKPHLNTSDCFYTIQHKKQRAEQMMSMLLAFQKNTTGCLSWVSIWIHISVHVAHSFNVIYSSVNAWIIAAIYTYTARTAPS